MSKREKKIAQLEAALIKLRKKRAAEIDAKVLEQGKKDYTGKCYTQTFFNGEGVMYIRVNEVGCRNGELFFLTDTLYLSTENTTDFFKFEMENTIHYTLLLLNDNTKEIPASECEAFFKKAEDFKANLIKTFLNNI